MMIDNIKTFFDRFVDDFSLFDGELIASRYLSPYVAVSSSGDIWQCSERSEIIEYFQSLLDKHQSQGVVCCKYEDLEFTPIGENCFFATVTWTMMAEESKVVSTWRESYNLVKSDSGLKIFTSIDH